MNLKRFFSRLTPLVSKALPFVFVVFSLVLSLLVVFTVLSRFGYMNLLGVSVVLTDSMVPSIRPGDMVFYFNAGFGVGDVVVYCVTPSHCVVHRVVDFIVLDTVNGYRTMVVTKGDSVDVVDSPVEIGRVRGRVVFSIPREIWIPIAVALLAYTLYSLIKTPIVGYSYAVMLSVALVLVVAVYAAIPRPIELETVKPPVVNLAGVYFDPSTCSIRVRYTGELSLTNASVEVNSVVVDYVVLYAKEVVIKPSPSLLRESFEYRKPLLIAVRASLNNVGSLFGEYDLYVGGVDPGVSVANGTLVIKNLNCFPVAVNVSIRYLDSGSWVWSNKSYIIQGFSTLSLEPPRGALHPYAYVYWYNQGDKRWAGLPLGKS
ncbi:MAG: S26 family signal peptidase [Desulfurococcaceae archaeon]